MASSSRRPASSLSDSDSDSDSKSEWRVVQVQVHFVLVPGTWVGTTVFLAYRSVRNTKNQITYRSIIDTITLLQPYLGIRSHAYRLYEIHRRCIMDMCDNYSNTVSACLCS